MNLDDARRELARRARRKELRIVRWTRLRPCDWRPTSVINPESGLPFTDVRAWEYIAELLDAGHPLDEIELDQPPGEIGYAMTVTLSCTSPDLYIKAQFLGVYILGRSFHYSDY